MDVATVHMVTVLVGNTLSTVCVPKNVTEVGCEVHSLGSGKAMEDYVALLSLMNEVDHTGRPVLTLHDLRINALYGPTVTI